MLFGGEHGMKVMRGFMICKSGCIYAGFYAAFWIEFMHGF